MIWLVARREIVTRGRSRAFQAITAILFIGVLGLALAMPLLGGGDGPKAVTIGVEEEASRFADALAVPTDALEPTVVVADNGRELLEAGDIDALVADTAIVWNEAPDAPLDSFIRSAVQQVTISDRADQLGISADDVTVLLGPVDPDEIVLDGDDDASGVRLIAALLATGATYLLLMVWGSYLMAGVTEEKSSKVIEVLLSHVRPATLLAGKVLGLGLLGLAQMLILVLGAAVGLMFSTYVEIPTGVWITLPLLLATFILGFGFYATAFAAVGAMVSRQEDAQNAVLPITIPLLLAYFIGFTSIDNPDNLAITIGSYVPFTSPVLLPFRTALTDVPLWSVALSLAILAASIPLMLKVAGRIYRYSLLRSGTRVRLGEAWRNRHTSTP